MGKRSRKRAVSGAAAEVRPRAARPTPATDPHPRTIDRRARLDEAPKAPWSPFPLVELCIFIALVLIVVGFVTDGPKRGVLLGCGIALVTLASTELAIREHFSGYRSHSSLLGGVAAIGVAVPLALLTSIPRVALLVVGVLVFGAVFQVCRSAFARRAGGLKFRV